MSDQEWPGVLSCKLHGFRLYDNICSRCAGESNMENFLKESFIKAMNDVGRHGYEKYGDHIASVTSRKPGPRWSSQGQAEHAREHFSQYLLDEPHDHFGTRKHQLAAVAFNAMMEYCYAGLESEEE